MIDLTITQMPDDIILGLPDEMEIKLEVFAPSAQDLLSLRTRWSRPLDRRWMVSMSGSDIESEHWQNLESFIDEVQGPTGIFTFWPPIRQIPVGKATGFGGKIPPTETFADGTIYADGTSIVTNDFSGYAQADRAKGAPDLVIENLVASTSDVLVRGDFFSIFHGPRQIPTLYRVLKPAHSDANGHAVVECSPHLRYNVRNGDRINFFRPRGTFQFAEFPSVRVKAPLLGDTTLELVELPEVLYAHEVV